MAPHAFIFDVFGTLVDWRSSIAGQLCRTLSAKGLDPDCVSLADEWRGEYQPAMERIRSGNRGYVALDVLHRENLEIVLARHDILHAFSADEVTILARAWEKLDPWPDAVSGLTKLRTHGLIAPCSNGSIALMAHLARHAHFPWDCILGADIARTYKPHPDVYRACCDTLRLAPADVMMVACHNSDLEAAQSAGLQTGFVPRAQEFGEKVGADLSPSAEFDIAAADLNELAAKIASKQ